MTINTFETNSYCFGDRHISATKNIYGSVTSKGNKVLIGFYSICNRKKSMTVSDNTLKAEGLGDFFQILGKKGLNVSKNCKKLSIQSNKALDLTDKIATAAASRNSKQALSTLPELIAFYNTGKGLHLGKFVQIMVNKWTRKRIDYIPQHHLKIKILILNKN